MQYVPSQKMFYGGGLFHRSERADVQAESKSEVKRFNNNRSGWTAGAAIIRLILFLGLLVFGMTVFIELPVCLWLFLALAIVCDDYLCPAIEVFCDRMQIPEEAAGASILAFGSSAPEIMINVAAAVQGKVEMSLSAIMGSAIIAFGLIPGVVAVSEPVRCNNLDARPIIRDTSFYLLSLLMLLYYLEDGFLDAVECLFLSAVFGVYIAAIYIPILHDRKEAGMPSFGSVSPRSSKGADMELSVMGEYGSVAALDEDMEPVIEGGEAADAQTVNSNGGDGDGDGDGNEPSTPLEKFIAYLSVPINVLFTATIPACEEGNQDRYPVTFAVSLFYVALLSDFVLVLAKDMAGSLHIQHAVVGATLLALGAQVPDTIGSYSMAKSGMCNGAISNAIGSQVINVSLGTGLPFFFYCLLNDRPLAVHPSNVVVLAYGLGITIAAYLVALFWDRSSAGEQFERGVLKAKSQAGLDDMTGKALLLVYFLVNAVMVHYGA